MRAQLREDLTVALKSRDRDALAALRCALSAIDNAEAVNVPAGTPVGGMSLGSRTTGYGDPGEVERRQLSATDVARIVCQEVSERRVAADKYERVGRVDRAERLRAEARVLNRYIQGLD